MKKKFEHCATRNGFKLSPRSDIIFTVLSFWIKQWLGGKFFQKQFIDLKIISVRKLIIKVVQKPTFNVKMNISSKCVNFNKTLVLKRNFFSGWQPSNTPPPLQIIIIEALMLYFDQIKSVSNLITFFRNRKNN